MDFEKLCFISQQFFVNSEILNIETVESGCINKTYIVEHLHNGRKSKFVLQSLSKIFKSHKIVNKNHKLVTDHMYKKINDKDFNLQFSKWEVPDLIKCKSNNMFVFPFESYFWRAMVYINDTLSFDFLEDEMMAYQAGLGLAKFHIICSDIDASILENSISNFHNTNYYIEQYFISLKEFDFEKLNDFENNRVHSLINCLSKHFGYVESLYESLINSNIDQNVIHGDPKISNFLFDIDYKHVVALIDLDTVSAGYKLTDLADCIRSICYSSGKNPYKKDNIYFDTNYCMYFLKGYLSKININNESSFRYLQEFIYLIIFELSIRFLTDFLQSNKYFKIKYETHNLFRAEGQYRLLSSFLTQVPNLSEELQEIGIYSSPTFVSNVQKFV